MMVKRSKKLLTTERTYAKKANDADKQLEETEIDDQTSSSSSSSQNDTKRNKLARKVKITAYAELKSDDDVDNEIIYDEIATFSDNTLHGSTANGSSIEIHNSAPSLMNPNETGKINLKRSKQKYKDKLAKSANVKKQKHELNKTLNLASNKSTNVDADFINRPEMETYRIGDWIYCEFEPDEPFYIRKIEEFMKNVDGTIEARLRCAFRRRDLPASLLSMLEKRYSQFTVANAASSTSNNDSISGSETAIGATTTSSMGPSLDTETISDMNKLKQRELFYSKFVESNVSVSCFRGKLNLTMFTPEVNSLSEFIFDDKSDNFFYQIAYDPNLKSLSQDKIEIRVGPKYQADIPDLIVSSTRSSPSNGKKKQKLNKTTSSNAHLVSCDGELGETLMWNGPESCHIGEIALNKYFNNIIDNKLISNETLVKNAEINQSRDSIKYDAMKHLHLCGYDRAKALATFNYNNIYEYEKQNEELYKTNDQERNRMLTSLQETNQASGVKKYLRPLTKNEIADENTKLWNKEQIGQFAEGLQKNGKDFHQTHKTLLTTKPLNRIVEYYYNAWKITDDYIEKRDLKRAKKSQKLVQIETPKLNFFRSENVSECDDHDGRYCISCNRSRPNSSFTRQTNLQQTFGDKQHPKYLSNILNQPHVKSNELTSTAEFTPSKQKLISEFFKSSKENKSISNPFSSFKSAEASVEQSHTAKASTCEKYDNLCNDCWLYWKKFGSFKNNRETTGTGSSLTGASERTCPEKRQERLAAIRNQSFKCTYDQCGMEFKKQSEIRKHTIYSHCVTIKNNILIQAPVYKPINNFYLKTSQFTKAARLAYAQKSLGKLTLSRLARSPFREIITYQTIKNECDVVDVAYSTGSKHSPSDAKLETKNRQLKQKNFTKTIKRIKSNARTAQNNKAKKTRSNEKQLVVKIPTSSCRPLTPLSPLSCECNLNDSMSCSTSSSSSSLLSNYTSASSRSTLVSKYINKKKDSFEMGAPTLLVSSRKNLNKKQKRDQDLSAMAGRRSSLAANSFLIYSDNDQDDDETLKRKIATKVNKNSTRKSLIDEMNGKNQSLLISPSPSPTLSPSSTKSNTSSTDLSKPNRQHIKSRMNTLSSQNLKFESNENNKLRKRTPQNVTCNFESVKKTTSVLQLNNDHLNSTLESNDTDKSVTKILSKYGRTLQKTASTLNTANTQSTGGRMKTLKKIFEYNKYVDWSFHANETIQTLREKLVDRKQLKRLSREPCKYSTKKNLFDFVKAHLNTKE